jgi:pyrroline-5-carboxylate reductase
MKIAIIGGGNMGSTYAKTFVQSNIVQPEDLLIIEKHSEKAEALKSGTPTNIKSSIDASIRNYDTIIIAVKPQDFKIMSSELKQFLTPGQLIISIMAGITIDTIKTLLAHAHIVRAMPNTPAQLGFGITAFTAAEGIPLESISKVDMLFETTGKSILLKDEALLDAVTALSGSGPAYFYYFVKNLIEAGKQMGIEEPIAALLVKQTMLGAFQIMNTSKLSLDEMIQMVASKGGTTEAALNRFETAEIGKNIITAVKAAEIRAKELSHGTS